MPTLSSLPLEIRYMIYDLVMLFQPGIGGLRSYETSGHGQTERTDYRKLSEQDRDQGLCLVNRQVYLETEHLTHTNPVRLTLDDISGAGRLFDLQSLVMGKKWLRQNMRELRLRIGCSQGITIPSKEDVNNCAGYSFELENNVVVVENQAPQQYQTPVSLLPITTILSTLPNLLTIELLFAHFPLFWPTFWFDLNAITTSTPNCSLKIVVANEDFIVDLFRFIPAGQLMMTSSWQYGEHCFEQGDAESGTWRRSGLDVGMRWENCWKVVEGSDGGRGGLSVEVLIRG